MVNYRVTKNEIPSDESQTIKPRKKNGRNNIYVATGWSKLKKAIGVANWKFEDLLQFMEPKHPDLMRQLCKPEEYIDKILKPDMLPIDRDDALTMIEAFLVHHFIEIDIEV